MIKRVAIFASGSGSNAEAIMSYAASVSTFEVAMVICNRREAGIYSRAAKYNIECIHFSKKDILSSPDELVNLLIERRIDFIALAGFLVKIPSELISAFPDAIVNIHPSLLPKYGGKGMYGQNIHRAVIEAGEKESGLTIHLVTEEYDKGTYLFQYKVPVFVDDTPENLGDRILQKEHNYYPLVLEYACTGMK